MRAVLCILGCMIMGLILCACVTPEYHEKYEREEVKGPDYYFRDGIEDFKKGEIREAHEDFEKAIRLRPDFVEAHFWRGQCYEKLGQLDAALRSYEDALRYDSRYLPAREVYGLLLFELKRYKEAEPQLETARDLGSRAPQVYYALGRVELAEKECRKAIDNFKEALRLDPTYIEAREGIEKAEERCGRHREERRPPRTEKSFKGGGKAIEDW